MNYGYLPALSYNVAIGATSTQSQAVSAIMPKSVRLVANTDCWVKFGVNPTADATTSMLLKANVIEYFSIPGGDVIATLQSSASGSLNITEMTR